MLAPLAQLPVTKLPESSTHVTEKPRRRRHFAWRVELLFNDRQEWSPPDQSHRDCRMLFCNAAASSLLTLGFGKNSSKSSIACDAECACRSVSLWDRRSLATPVATADLGFGSVTRRCNHDCCRNGALIPYLDEDTGLLFVAEAVRCGKR